jgi:DNA-binding response OmpR family regulator
MSEAISVLLVEDDARLAAFTVDYLRLQGMQVQHLPAAEGLRAALDQQRPDVLVLDQMLPGTDGLSACREVRTYSDVPILFVTARGDEQDRVIGLELGADDYISKPFSPRELVARIRAVARRHRGELSALPAIRAGRLTLQPSERTATLDGAPLPLTTSEFNLLMVFAQHAGQVLTREQLVMKDTASPPFSVERAVDVQVSRLRQKLRADDTRPELIVTVRGVGYLFNGG